MRVFIVTQNEPFYLATAINYFLQILNDDIEIVGCIVLDGSPFGKREGFLKKALRTLRVFGISFFIYYGIKFLWSKVFRQSVQKVLKSHDIPTRRLSGSINDPKVIEDVEYTSPDIIVSIAAPQIFGAKLRSVAKIACLNLHTAKLPKYRGLMPLFWALSHNEKSVGISVFEIDAGIDSGPIVSQIDIPTLEQSMEELIIQTRFLGMSLLAETIHGYAKGPMKVYDNSDSESTIFSFPNAQDVKRFRKTGRMLF